MFITFEGPEGSGKTTHWKSLTTFLQQEGYKVFSTREPGGTGIGDQIRQVLMDHQNTAMHPRTEILLFTASRSQHVEEIILPRLKAGEIVLCDRYGDSTLAYQGYGHGMDLEILRTLNRFATGNLIPDLTLLFDVDVSEGLNRRAKDGGWNRLDAYPAVFHKRVQQGYRELVHLEPERWVTIDANPPLEVVQQAMQKAVLERLRK